MYQGSYVANGLNLVRGLTQHRIHTKRGSTAGSLQIPRQLVLARQQLSILLLERPDAQRRHAQNLGLADTLVRHMIPPPLFLLRLEPGGQYGEQPLEMRVQPVPVLLLDQVVGAADVAVLDRVGALVTVTAAAIAAAPVGGDIFVLSSRGYRSGRFW